MATISSSFLLNVEIIEMNKARDIRAQNVYQKVQKMSVLEGLLIPEHRAIHNAGRDSWGGDGSVIIIWTTNYDSN